jgi:hypothetical protein
LNQTEQNNKPTGLLDEAGFHILNQTFDRTPKIGGYRMTTELSELAKVNRLEILAHELGITQPTSDTLTINNAAYYLTGSEPLTMPIELDSLDNYVVNNQELPADTNWMISIRVMDLMTREFVPVDRFLNKVGPALKGPKPNDSTEFITPGPEQPTSPPDMPAPDNDPPGGGWPVPSLSFGDLQNYHGTGSKRTNHLTA